jgi:hypothetical protein
MPTILPTPVPCSTNEDANAFDAYVKDLNNSMLATTKQTAVVFTFSNSQYVILTGGFSPI